MRTESRVYLLLVGISPGGKCQEQFLCHFSSVLRNTAPRPSLLTEVQVVSPLPLPLALISLLLAAPPKTSLIGVVLPQVLTALTPKPHPAVCSSEQESLAIPMILSELDKSAHHLKMSRLNTLRTVTVKGSALHCLTKCFPNLAHPKSSFEE